MSSKRRVFHFNTHCAPTEPSEFACLPRDLAHLVLINLRIPELCPLKATSHAVANACRRAIRSSEVLDKDNDVIAQAIGGCQLAFPMKALFNIRYADMQNTIGKEMIVHEFEVEFYQKGKRVYDVNKVKEWNTTSWEYINKCINPMPTKHKEYILSMTVECIRFCVELPREGIFFSYESLKKHLGLFSVADDGAFGPSFSYQYEILDFACNLEPIVPIALINSRMFLTFDCPLDGSIINEGRSNTFFNMILGERLHNQPFCGQTTNTNTLTLRVGRFFLGICILSFVLNVPFPALPDH